MKIVIAFLMAVLASVSGFSQKKAGKSRQDSDGGQHIIPYKIEVTFSKDGAYPFPAEVRAMVDLGSNNIIAGKADGVENVVRIKAAVKSFLERQTSGYYS